MKDVAIVADVAETFLFLVIAIVLGRRLSERLLRERAF
jgi:hypothetical protein